jgi:hypothetical protein
VAAAGVLGCGLGEAGGPTQGAVAAAAAAVLLPGASAPLAHHTHVRPAVTLTMQLQIPAEVARKAVTDVPLND